MLLGAVLPEGRTALFCFDSVSKFEYTPIAPMGTSQAIIARYEEDVSWARKLAMPVVVYSKGKSATGLEGELPVVARKNVGRETETFLFYIVEQYEQLPDYVAFLQGDPFAHCKNVLHTLAGNVAPKQVVPLSTNWKREMVGRYDWPGFEECIRDLAGIIGVPPTVVSYATGAQYLVPRDAIMSRPKALYEQLLTRLSQSTHPHEAWAMERLWPYLFGWRNQTDQIKIDIVVVGQSSAAYHEPRSVVHDSLAAAADFLEQKRSDVKVSIAGVFDGKTGLEWALKNSQDYVLFVRAGEALELAAIDELLETYQSFKFTYLKEDDLCLGLADDPSLYEPHNLQPSRIVRAGGRHWRESQASCYSFLTHKSVLVQHSDLFAGPDPVLDAQPLWLLRGVPFFIPMPSLVFLKQ